MFFLIQLVALTISPNLQNLPNPDIFLIIAYLKHKNLSLILYELCGSTFVESYCLNANNIIQI